MIKMNALNVLMILAAMCGFAMATTVDINVEVQDGYGDTPDDYAHVFVFGTYQSSGYVPGKAIGPDGTVELTVDLDRPFSLNAKNINTGMGYGKSGGSPGQALGVLEITKPSWPYRVCIVNSGGEECFDTLDDFDFILYPNGVMDAEVMGGCEDTDGGDDYYEAGTASGTYYLGGWGADDYRDSCTVVRDGAETAKSDYIKEYRCGSDGLVYMYYDECDPGYTCEYGACVTEDDDSPRCEETDEGFNLFEKGTSTRYSGSSVVARHTDYCEERDSVHEYWCESGTLRLMGDAYDCPSGYLCSDGECVIEPEPAGASCSDSDGGKDYYEGGTAYGTHYVSGEAGAFTDSCTVVRDGAETERSDYIKEFWCGSDGLVHMYYDECAAGYTCEYGACVEDEIASVSCVETDDGYNIYEKGTSREYDESGLVKTETDFCVSDNNVKEYYCSESDRVLRGIMAACGTGYSCVDGACVRQTETHEYSCGETDGGLDLFERGTLTRYDNGVAGATGTDYCDGSGSVHEYWCAMPGSLASEMSYSCPSGYSCEDGACAGGGELPPPVPDEAAEEYTMRLNAGWNLLSSPLGSGSGKATVVESTCGSAKVYVYDPDSNAYTSSGYGLGEGDYLPVPDAFWVKASSSCKVVVKGDQESMYDGWTPRIGSGWAGIGGLSAASRWGEVKGNCELLSGPWAFDSDAWAWKKATVLYPGVGYFVKLAGTCTMGGEIPPLPFGS